MVKSAIILANDNKGLQPVFGMPAVRRLVLLARKIGLETVHIVSGTETIFGVLSDLLPPQSFHVVEDPGRIDRAIQDMDLSDGEGVLVARADHVVDRWSLTRLVQGSAGTSLSSLNRDGGRNDEGIYVASTDELPELLRRLWSPEASDPMFFGRAVQVTGAPGLPSLIGRDGEPARTSEDLLTASLRFATKTRDSFMARHVDRHLSALISQRLARTPIKSNQITLVNLATGLVSAFLFFKGSYFCQVFGSLVFLLCVVLDGVDGEVARLKLQESVSGHYLDIITDNVVHLAIFVGLGLGLYRQTEDRLYLYTLAGLLGGACLCAIIVERLSKRLDITKPGKVDMLTRLLANRDFAYLLVALALAGRLNWFLIGAAAGSYVFAAALWFLDLHHTRQTPR